MVWGGSTRSARVLCACRTKGRHSPWCGRKERSCRAKGFREPICQKPAIIILLRSPTNDDVRRFFFLLPFLLLLASRSGVVACFYEIFDFFFCFGGTRGGVRGRFGLVFFGSTMLWMLGFFVRGSGTIWKIPPFTS